MNTKILHFFALCLIGICFSGCFYTTGGYMQIGGEIHGYDDYPYGYRTPRERVVVVPRKEPVMVVSNKTIIMHDYSTKTSRKASKW